MFRVIIRLIQSLFIITITVCTLQRHFAVFRLPAPTAESLFTIVTSILEVCSNGSFSLNFRCLVLVTSSLYLTLTLFDHTGQHGSESRHGSTARVSRTDCDGIVYAVDQLAGCIETFTHSWEIPLPV